MTGKVLLAVIGQGVRDANHSMIHRTIPLSKEVFCLKDESRHESLTIPSNVTKSLSSLSDSVIIVSSGKNQTSVSQSPHYVPCRCDSPVWSLLSSAITAAPLRQEGQHPRREGAALGSCVWAARGKMVVRLASLACAMVCFSLEYLK